MSSKKLKWFDNIKLLNLKTLSGKQNHRLQFMLTLKIFQYQKTMESKIQMFLMEITFKIMFFVVMVTN